MATIVRAQIFRGLHVLMSLQMPPPSNVGRHHKSVITSDNPYRDQNGTGPFDEATAKRLSLKYIEGLSSLFPRSYAYAAKAGMPQPSPERG
jgi:hypothetical protein